MKSHSFLTWQFSIWIDVFNKVNNQVENQLEKIFIKYTQLQEKLKEKLINLSFLSVDLNGEMPV